MDRITDEETKRLATWSDQRRSLRRQKRLATVARTEKILVNSLLWTLFVFALWLARGMFVPQSPGNESPEGGTYGWGTPFR